MEINKPVSTIIVIIISLLLVLLFVFPKYQEVRNLQVSISQKQAEYNGKSVYYAKISELLTQIQSRKDVLEKVSSSLPADFSLADITYFFQENAANNGLIVKSLEFSQASPVAYRKTSVNGITKELKNILFTINFLGSYQGFKQFLAVLDTSSRLFEANTISFAPVQTPEVRGRPNSLAPVYDFKLEVVTHAY